MGNLKTIRKKSRSRKSPEEAGLKVQDQLVALFAQGRFDEVLAKARALTRQFPQDGFGWKVIGVVLSKTGQTEEGLAAMQRAAALAPDDVEVHNNLGTMLLELGQTDKAEAHCRRAIELAPNNATAHRHLGNALQEQGRLVEAVACFRASLAIEPDHPPTLNNLGVALIDLDQADEATLHYQSALRIQPESAEFHNNLGTALQRCGRFDEAIARYRRALSIKPDFARAHSNLLMLLNHDPATSPEMLAAEQRRFASVHEAPHRPHWPDHANTRDPDCSLRIGFVSADLRYHAIANFIEPIFAHIVRSPALTVFIYSNHSVEDQVTRRFQAWLPNWRKVATMSDSALAALIAADQIDILVDLSSHTAGNRLPVFARKPAPLQVSWMGMPGTTGLTAMDYYFSDQSFLPPGQFDQRFTEKIVFLPGSAPFLPSELAPPVNPLPALTNGYLTFGSFNRLIKLSPVTVGLWASLLQALPDARMMLGGFTHDEEISLLSQWFDGHGIGRYRLSFQGRRPMADYLALHHHVDLCLDTFPYNGGTTTCHALWMGIPTLTMTGDFIPSRTGAAVLSHVGMDPFIAANPEEFVAKGVSCARNLESLAAIRHGLRECMRHSTLCRPERIAAGVEQAFRTMWRRWCAGQPAESFTVHLPTEHGEND